MKVMSIARYGSPDVFQGEERPQPVPGPKDLLVRVRASSVNYGDLVARDFGHLRSQDFNMPWLMWFLANALVFGFKSPKVRVLGSEFSGVVEAVGAEVQGYQKGDSVFGHTEAALGAYAEYLCLPSTGSVAPKPAHLSHEEAATVPYGAVTALALLSPLGLQAGQSLAILGASGSIGAAAVQLASSWGVKVTGVCGPQRQAYVRSLGAEEVIDYTKEDFTAGGRQYDVVFDVLGRGRFSQVKKVLKPKGRYLLASFKIGKLLQMLWTSWFGGKKVICGLAPSSPAGLKSISELLSAGKLRAVVDRVFPLEQVADAHRYAEGGQRQGGIAVAVG